MSIRKRVFSIILLLAVVIIVFGIGSGLVFVQYNLENTIISDMTAIAGVADKFVSTSINLLKADASIVIQRLNEVSDDDLHEALRWYSEAYDNFTALTVFDRGGIVDSYSTTSPSAATPFEFIDSEYMQRAFAGEAVMSTTQINSNGELVFYLCVPMRERVLSVTIPGMFFRDIFSGFKIWNTGNIFMVDAEGTVLANIREDWVLERYNFIKMAQIDNQYERVAATVSRMIKGEPGESRFAIEGNERFCVFRPVTGSRVSWALGVVAPIAESPLQNVRNGLLLVGTVCILLSVVAAYFASVFLERPYKTISELVTTLESQGKLLHAINEAAVTLLHAETGDFNNDILDSVGLIARCANVDRMRVWQNHTKDGELYCSQLYEWSEGAEPQAGKRITVDVSYSRSIPGWEEKLSGGQPLSLIARNFSPEEQAQLSPQGVFSILVIPVFIHKDFWGFVCFDDCHKERVFSADDESLLRSGGLLIANAILRNDMTHDLVRAREEAVASAEAKSVFLANMSHEMRTPLNAIIGLTELTLDTDGVDGSALENLEKVYNSGVTLLSLINDILDISKIESGKFELVPVEYDTPSLVNDTVALNIVRIGSKPIVFNLDIDETMPSRLLGDELRVKQVFNNLLSNAFKYTKEGVVVWRVTFESDGDDIWLVSSVKDSGIGILPKDLKKLFSQYDQVDTKSNRKIEGTGLGLSICKSMVELMDGKIAVESEYGKGSTFTVRVRQGKASNSVPIGPEVAENLRNFHYFENKRDRSAKLVRAHIPYAKVLVVDDVPTNLDVARGMMKPYGMQIDCVTSGPAAIDLIREGNVKYNAIFMDHMMPGMDGIETTRIIREEIGTDYARNVPVIALTANAIVGNEDMFLHKGFQAFLSKPIDIMRMDVVINHWVRDKDLEKKLSRNGGLNVNSGSDKKRIADISRINVKGIDVKQGLKRFGGDEDIYLNVLKSYAKNTPPLLDQLRDCAQEGLPNYAIVVHGIKSSSRSIGAEPIGARAEALELAAKSGNLAFVLQKNDDFITTVHTLLESLSAILQTIAEENPKPQKAEPDAGALADLLEACKSFDIDGVAQGANDPRVNKAESDQIVEAVKKNGQNVVYLVKENEGHGFHNEENRFDFYRAMEEFFRAHLGLR
ncbi:hypothetical protein FACS1894187_22460 [Synergistales bacterium]|nr:hypothetical protein FACS1894187_22460 [Synergistales bacterium]